MSCPICGKETAQDYRPFCSKRCADIDLARWLKGDYAIPVQEEEDDSDETRRED
ncbi:MAG: DNA gyrase inhibitor YacG [Rubricella sp.]